MAVRTSNLDIPTADGVADSFLAAPDDDAPYPGVLFYPDAFGPRPRTEEMARHIAERGYVVLVPHLFYRQGRAPLLDTSTLKDPDARGSLFAKLRPWMNELTPERAMSDAESYLDFLAGQDAVADGPMGVTGYCMGGALALRTAAHRPEQIAAAAAFHPARLATDAPDSPHLLADRIAAEVYVGSADGDPGMPPEQQRMLDEALTEAGVRHTCEQYDGAAHGFTMADTAVYDEAATERHWENLLSLLDRNLRS
ncbi:MAG: dienelactone hydrolase family protein [Nocardioidaceae bacterium]